MPGNSTSSSAPQAISRRDSGDWSGKRNEEASERGVEQVDHGLASALAETAKPTRATIKSAG